MSYPVTYYCPNCGTLVELERDGYLSDKAVTPYPFEGWEYVSPDDDFEDGAADGVEFVCGDRPVPADDEDADGCGESFISRSSDSRRGRRSISGASIRTANGSNSPREASPIRQAGRTNPLVRPDPRAVSTDDSDPSRPPWLSSAVSPAPFVSTSLHTG